MNNAMEQKVFYYPVVKVKTKDGLVLHGLLHTPQEKTKRVIVHVHGTSGSFYWSDYYNNIFQVALTNNFSYLQTNNRGSGVFEYEDGTIPHGAALEKYEDSILDLDAWLEFCIQRGFIEIILEAHSFGNEKVIYYMNKGKYKEYVKGIVLLGFNDSVGTQGRYEKKIGKKYLTEAQELVKEGKGMSFLSDIFGGIAGEVPITADSYLNFYSEGSELSKTMPLRLGRDLLMYRNIKVPILAVIGDNEEGEYTIIPIKKAMELMHKENPLTDSHQISNCNHGFNGKEKELAQIINNFLVKNFTQS